MKVTINGTEVNVLIGSLNISDVIEERSTASFSVKDDAGEFVFHKGQPVKILDNDSNLIYSGFIDTPKAQKITGVLLKVHDISCIDNHYLADKRIIAKAYQNMTAGAIVHDIITNYLAVEGVSAGIIQDGPTITEAVFNYVPVTTALASLAEKANFWWTIDFNKLLQFMDRSANTAPWVCTGVDIQGESLTVGESNPNYRNKQYIKGGTDVTDHMTENFKGDGTTRTWNVGFKINSVPTIALNGTQLQSSDIGIRGVDSGKKYYWSKGETAITQDDGQTLLTTSDTLSITYQGQFDIIAITEDPGAISTMQQIEGIGTGIVEEVEDEPDNTSRETAFQSGNAKLQKYAVIGNKVTFRTKRYGLVPGQLLTMNVPEHNLDNTEVLIENVTTTDEGGIFLWYDITAVEGPEEGSWAKVFQKMATRGQSFVVRENISEEQVLITLKQFTKTWQLSNKPNIFIEVYPGSNVFPGSDIFPMFVYGDRVKYIELLDASNNTLVRKKITKQTGSDTTNILSTTYIAPYEANTSIAKVRFYGGSQATDTIGLGVMIDEQVYSKVKTQLEALQIDKTDSRGW